MQSNLYKAQKQNIHRNGATTEDFNDDEEDEDDDRMSESADHRQNSRVNTGNPRSHGSQSNTNAKTNRRERDNVSANGDKMRDVRAPKDSKHNPNSPSYVIDKRKNMGSSSAGVVMNSPSDTVMATPHR